MAYPADLQLGYVDSIEDCLAMKRWLSEDRGREMVGVDLETSGLDPYAPGARVRLIQLGDGHTGWAVPWERWGGAALECLRAWPGRLGIFKASFEAQWFARFFDDYDLPWERVHDVMLHAKIMRPELPADLKGTAARMVDRRAGTDSKKLADLFRRQGWTWDTVPLHLPTYLEYAALDPVLTVLLWEKLRADIAHPQVYDLEMGAQRVCTGMSIRGARVDTDYAQENYDVLDAKVDAGQAWARKNMIAPDPRGVLKAVNTGSSPQVVSYFTNTLGAQVTETSPKTGAPSVNKVQLKKFAQGDDDRVSKSALFLMKLRYAERLRKAYFGNILSRTHDGLLHCGINTMGAITARMSIQQPSMQNLPKNDPLVRGCFIPREGNSIISSDLDQVEFRLFACLAGDPALIKAFHDADATGVDTFTQIARQIYHDASITKDDSRRALVKTYIYATLFGAGLEKQAKSANVSLAEMERFAKTIRSAYPGMQRFQQSVYDTVGGRERDEGRGYVLTPTTGRRLPVEKDKNYKGVNYTIQSTAADIFKEDLLELEAHGLAPFLLVPVHDEIVLDVPTELLADVEPVLRECMTTIDPSRWALPLTAGVDGPFARWGQKHKMSLTETLAAGVQRQLDEDDEDDQSSDGESPDGNGARSLSSAGAAVGELAALAAA